MAKEREREKKSATGRAVLLWEGFFVTHVVPATSTYATGSGSGRSTVTRLLSCGVSKVSNTTMPQKNSSSSYYPAGVAA